jgi:hypothetical protein
MTMSRKDLGMAQVLLKRLNDELLPQALSMKQRVDRGERLTEYERRILAQVAEDARVIMPLAERLTQFKTVTDEAMSLFAYIATKDRDNEP